MLTLQPSCDLGTSNELPLVLESKGRAVRSLGSCWIGHFQELSFAKRPILKDVCNFNGWIDFPCANSYFKEAPDGSKPIGPPNTFPVRLLTTSE